MQKSCTALASRAATRHLSLLEVGNADVVAAVGAPAPILTSSFVSARELR